MRLNGLLPLFTFQFPLLRFFFRYLLLSSGLGPCFSAGCGVLFLLVTILLLDRCSKKEGLRETETETEIETETETETKTETETETETET